MVLKASQERVRTLLKDTITLLCKNGLEFKKKFNIEALIGVTLDDDEVFLISMNELVSADRPKPAADDVSDHSDWEEEAPATPDTTTSRTKKHKRRSSTSSRSDADKAVLIKAEPRSPVHTEHDDGIAVNPKSEDLWGGEESTGSGQLESEEPELKKPHLEREVDEEEIEDLVFVKEELGGMEDSYDPSCSYDKGMSFDNSQDYSQSSDMTLTPLGSQDGAMIWSQSVQNQGQQQQQPQRRHYTPRSRTGTSTATITSENSDIPLDQRTPQPSSTDQEGVEGYKCSLCGKLFKSQFSCLTHENIHRKQYRYHCPICGKGFMATNTLRGHMWWHTGVAEYNCTICSKEYRYKHRLKEHMIMIHGLKPS